MNPTPIRAQERVWISPSLTATDSLGEPVSVPVTGWEASIDSGTTWKASQDNAGSPGWLVAGAGFPGPGDSAAGGTTDFVLPASGGVLMLVRLRAAPETTIVVAATLTAI